MSFLSPAMFFLAGLLPVIIVMYLLKLRRVERTVSSTYLWRQMVRDVEANAPWQRLRRNLLLILQLLFLAALILALARPATPARGLSAQTAIFIIDTSASMGATDVTPSRIEAAKDEARRMVSELPDTAQVTVIDAGDKARVVASASTDRRQVLQAIENLQAGTGGSDLGVALQLASAIARRQSDAQTIVLSDGNATLPTRLSIQGGVQYLPVGLEDANQAIGALNLQNDPGSGNLTAFTQVINYGTQEAQRRLAIYADGQMVDAFDVTLTPGGEQAILAQGILSTTQVVEARLLDGQNGPAADFLAADDQAWAVHRASEPVSVTLSSPGNLFLETGLSLLPSMKVTRVNPGASLPEGGLTILDGLPPITGTLPSGALLFIGPLRSTEFFSVTGTIPSPAPAPASEREPLLEYVSLEGVNILDSARIPLPDWARPVIITDDPANPGQTLPLLFAGEVDGRRVAVLAFDLRRSDLPLQVAFPLLLANLTGWLAPGGSDLPTQAAPGAAISLSLPPDALLEGGGQVTVIRPDGVRTGIDASSGQVVFAETRQPGVYRVSLGGQETAFAVNLFAPQESRLEPTQELPITGVETAGQAAADDYKSEWWRLLAALALGLLTAEWLVYQRPALAMLASRLGQAFKRNTG